MYKDSDAAKERNDFLAKFCTLSAAVVAVAARKCSLKWALVSLALVSTAAVSQIRLGTPFGDNMVMQRGVSIPIWGEGAPGTKVDVQFSTATATTVVGSDGRWSLQLPQLSAGGPFDLLVMSRETLTIRNILVGEVWLCSGQSNMEFRLDRSDGADSAIAAARFPRMRLGTVPHAVSDTPHSFGKAAWVECSPSTVSRFSAVAYYFGKRLLEELNVPIGLLHVSWGGTNAESWMPSSALLGDPEFIPILERWQNDIKSFPEVNALFQVRLPALMDKWRGDSAAAIAEGKAPPARPQLPRGPDSRDTPSGQWNAMIHPLVPFAMRGVIWYQGEANAARAHQYRTLFPALIRSWRKAWENEALPFYYVQLPNLLRQPDPNKSVWAELRESQLMTLALPHTGMVVTIDVGDSLDLHPKNKRPVGERLARLALNKNYDRSQMVPSGPLYSGFTIERSTVRIAFTEIGGGLTARSPKNISGFTLSGEDRKFVPAQARIEGNEIVVESEAVKHPTAVRYAWGDNPDWSLTNAAGLPASPFRTDDWPMTSFGRK